MASASGTGPPPGAPPTKKLTKTRQTAWEKLGKDQEALKKMEESSKASRFFDYGAPSSRMARANARTYFCT
jgi:hypothetical protein